jgi:hypothetical protein
VQQLGFDDNNVMTTLPTTTLSYLSSTHPFYLPGNKQISNSAYVVANINGDGTNDINIFDPWASTDNVWLENFDSMSTIPGNGVGVPDYWSNSGQPNERGTRFIDVNGDGMADIVRGWVDNYATATEYAIFLNQYATSTNQYTWGQPPQIPSVLYLPLPKGQAEILF